VGFGAEQMAVRRRHATGYTLIELMAVLAIASALLVIAIPMFRTQVQNSRMSAAATDLLSTFMSAKSEAVGRGYPVTVCISNEDADGCADKDAVVCDNSEDGDDRNRGWANGWLTFVNVNDDADLDAGEDILQIHQPLHEQESPRFPGTMTACATGKLANSVTYRPNGLTDLSGTERLVICDKEKIGESSRVLVVSILGKVSILKAAETGEPSCQPE
jgi:type IV fimbrial biogenesis protein FimT